MSDTESIEGRLSVAIPWLIAENPHSTAELPLRIVDGQGNTILAVCHQEGDTTKPGQTLRSDGQTWAIAQLARCAPDLLRLLIEAGQVLSVIDCDDIPDLSDLVEEITECVHLAAGFCDPSIQNPMIEKDRLQ